MMSDRMMSILAFGLLTAFLGIMVWYVPRWDLGGAIGITLALVAWDFFVHKT